MELRQHRREKEFGRKRGSLAKKGCRREDAERHPGVTVDKLNTESFTGLRHVTTVNEFENTTTERMCHREQGCPPICPPQQMTLFKSSLLRVECVASARLAHTIQLYMFSSLKHANSHLPPYLCNSMTNRSLATETQIIPIPDAEMIRLSLNLSATLYTGR